MEPTWAELEMTGAAVWDPRCKRSLGTICRRLAERPGLSFSTACGEAARQAAHRIFAHPSTSVAGLLRGHYQQTAARALAQPPPGEPGPPPLVIVAQDTTELNYATHTATEGLGPIGRDPQVRGLFAHAGLALTLTGVPLGLVHLSLWARDGAEHGKKHRRKQRDTADKESQKWLEGLAGAEAALPPDQPLLVVGDREADVFDYFAAPRRPTTHLLVRATHPRRVRFGEKPAPLAPAEDTLFQCLASLPVQAEMPVRLPRSAQRPPRDTVLALRWVRLWLLPPRERYLRTKHRVAQEVWVVEAQEKVPAAAGAEPVRDPVHWVLLSTLPVADAATAMQVVGYYRLRWRIERLHYTLKSGLRVERLQFDDATSLSHALTLCYVVAWRLLALTYLTRSDPEAPAATVLEAPHLAVLSAWSKQPITTRREAMRAIAKLGGFPGNPAAGEPGVKTLWLGWTELERMVLGWQLARGTLSPMLQD